MAYYAKNHFIIKKNNNIVSGGKAKRLAEETA